MSGDGPPDLSRSGGIVAPTIDPPIDVLTDWRSNVAHWPFAAWLRWRRYAGEFLESLDRPATADEIRGAERAAYDFISWSIGMGDIA